VDVEVSSREDLARVLTVLTRIGESLARDMHGTVIESPSIVGIQRITGSGISIRLAAKTHPSAQGAVTHEWRRRIKETFDKEGIRLSEGPAALLPSPSAGI
jgi:small conductance mechanosensitive channel